MLLSGYLQYALQKCKILLSTRTEEGIHTVTIEYNNKRSKDLEIHDISFAISSRSRQAATAERRSLGDPAGDLCFYIYSQKFYMYSAAATSTSYIGT